VTSYKLMVADGHHLKNDFIHVSAVNHPILNEIWCAAVYFDPKKWGVNKNQNFENSISQSDAILKTQHLIFQLWQNWERGIRITGRHRSRNILKLMM